LKKIGFLERENIFLFFMKNKSEEILKLEPQDEKIDNGK
jgi:hypothetical protein